MSSSDASTIAAWNNTSAAINRYLSIFIYLFGTIGNILNALVLSQRTLRSNPCSLYFLISSLANLVAIIAGLTSRMLSGWAVDLTNTIEWLCKLRAFVLFISRNIAAWLILLAAIDRWLLSHLNVHRRQWSTLKNAYRGIVFTILLSIVLYCPIFYCYQANLTNAPLRCYGKDDICRLTNDLSYAFLTITFPIILMFIFGLLTIINIRQVKNRVHTVSATQANSMGHGSHTGQGTGISKKKLDRRLFLMLLFQIILLSVFTLPQAGQKLYSTLVSDIGQTPLKKAIDNFIFNLLLLFTYIANGMSFYIYTLSGGAIFRNALKDLMKKIVRKILSCFRCG